MSAPEIHRWGIGGGVTAEVHFSQAPTLKQIRHFKRHVDLLLEIYETQPEPDPLHPAGRCTCGNAGECAWCESLCAPCGGAGCGQCKGTGRALP